MAQPSGYKYHLPQPCRTHASDPPTTIYRAYDLFHLRDTARLRTAGSQAGRISLSPSVPGKDDQSPNVSGAQELAARQRHRKPPPTQAAGRRFFAPRAHRMDTWSQHIYRIPESFLVHDAIKVFDSNCVIDAKNFHADIMQRTIPRPASATARPSTPATPRTGPLE